MRPRQVCSTKGCPEFKPCPSHGHQAWQGAEPTKRITGRRLQLRRQQLFVRSPLCAECVREGRKTPSLATIRDHVVPLAEGGPDDSTNEQGLCDAHHDAKTQLEAQRGRQRAGWGVS